MRRLVWVGVAVVGAAGAAFALRPEPPSTVATTVVSLPTPSGGDAFPAALSDSTFARLVTTLSEPGGYFDTDNLISNESSYLHVVAKMRDLGIAGGAYLGVGPDQNFSYIAAIQPDIAFILDVRRDNMLQHLWYKALFETSPTRIEFLSALFGRRPPPDPAEWTGRTVDQHIDWIERQPADTERLDQLRMTLIERVVGYGVPLTEADLATIARIHATFASAGPALRYSSHGRQPQPSYPTYRRLLLETDRSGTRSSYLASEPAYSRVRELEQRNLVIPVTGNFAGDHALEAIGDYLRDRGSDVSAFYLSNVEFYLWQDRLFDRFARNVASLPVREDAVMIRSLFGRIYGHPQSVPGYNSTQLLQRMPTFISESRSGRYATYGDLIYGNYIDLR